MRRERPLFGYGESEAFATSPFPSSVATICGPKCVRAKVAAAAAAMKAAAAATTAMATAVRCPTILENQKVGGEVRFHVEATEASASVVFVLTFWGWSSWEGASQIWSGSGIVYGDR